MPWVERTAHTQTVPLYRTTQGGRQIAVVCRLDDAAVARGPFVLGPMTLEIGWADRIALVGRNGSGKTILVETLLGLMPLVTGSRHKGPGVVVGELGQDRRTVGDGGSVVDTLMRSTGLTVSEARSLLAKFGLGAGEALRTAGSLSPREHTRAELATYTAAGVNFLVLDEPTNHLDLPAIEQLESALSAYKGTLLVVTHDRRLLETLELTTRVELPAPGAASRGIRVFR